MSWVSSLLGTHVDNAGEGEYGQKFKKAIGQYEDPTYGSDQLAQLIQSQVSAAMPQFNQALGGVRENAIKRGISTGDLGTSYEGDLASSFQKHIADSVGSQAFNLFQGNRGTYLDLLNGGMDREQDVYNQNANAKGALWGSLIKGAGAAAGGFG